MEVEQHLTRAADDRGRIYVDGDVGGDDVDVTIRRSIDVDSLRTMRAVHFINAPADVRAKLYVGHGRGDAEAMFGVHWGTGPVWHEDVYKNLDWESAYKDYRGMNRAATGALVSAYYGVRWKDKDGPGPYNLNEHLVLGVCPPNSEIKAIPFDDGEGSTLFVKTLPLINTVEVSSTEYPDLFRDNVRGFSVYVTDAKEDIMREAYAALRD